MTAPAMLLWALAPRGPAETALTRVRRVKPVGLAPAWSHHCGDMWRAHVLAATGRDVCDIVGPSPRRSRDWAALMRRLGVRSIAGVISAVHGEPIPYRLAARGDIVLRGWAIGICRGDRAEFYGGEMVEMRGVDAAWRLQAAGHRLPHSTTADPADLDSSRAGATNGDPREGAALLTE